jgi:outer membrane protein OmpA-like peptidoglycan-associated protein
MTSIAQNMQSETAMPAEQNPVASEQPKVEAITTEVATVTYPDIDIEVTPKPEQLSFQFGFDKAELGEEDKAIIKQHAKYLIDNPEVIVKVVGHTDHNGPKAYNEYLSKKRAEAVAAILLAEGVMESQIDIKAMADEKPLETAQHASDNRRVELEFEQVNLVSN